MSEKEYKAKCESMFAKNTVLINENAELKKENEGLKVFSKELIEINNKLRDSLRKYEVVPDVDYLPNGIEIYKENIGNNPYSKE